MEKKTIDVEKFLQNHFHSSWHNKMRKFIGSKECLNILTTLTEENKKGKVILPSKNLIWRAFQETELDKMSTLFLALSPYPQRNTGDGLCFSNSLTDVESPSLRIIFDAMENDLGYKDTRDKDLKRWANAGVLMLNSALTCELNSPKSHLDLWKPLIIYLLKEVFNDISLKIVYFGADARAFSNLENKELHKSLAVEHPDFSARENRPMIHKSLFSWVNKELKKDGKKEINWMEFGELPWKEEVKKEYKEFI